MSSRSSASPEWQKGVDLPCLQKMAERNGGKFVHVAAKGD
jgi:hypothetical protein